MRWSVNGWGVRKGVEVRRAFLTKLSDISIKVERLQQVTWPWSLRPCSCRCVAPTRHNFPPASPPKPPPRPPPHHLHPRRQVRNHSDQAPLYDENLELDLAPWRRRAAAAAAAGEAGAGGSGGAKGAAGGGGGLRVSALVEWALTRLPFKASQRLVGGWVGTGWGPRGLCGCGRG